MTIREMILKNPSRCASLPESIFEVNPPSGERRLLCWASFLDPIELADKVSKNPDLLEWQVTKEFFTQEALDIWEMGIGYPPPRNSHLDGNPQSR